MGKQKMKLRNYYKAVVDNKGLFRGFITGIDDEEIEKKAKKLKLKPYGKGIMKDPPYRTE